MTKRLGQLDFLRGIALLGVIAVHTVADYSSIVASLDVFIEQGKHGVELFFAVSGYTMMMMYGSYSKKWRSPIKVFYIKRFMRIYPLFFMAAFAYLPMSLQPSYSDPDGTQIRDLIQVLTLTGGFHPSTLNAVVPGGWSITNEMYFYLLFPVLAYLAYRLDIIFVATAICLVNFCLYAFAHDIYAMAPGNEYLVELFQYRSFFNQFLLFYTGIEAYRTVAQGKQTFWRLWVPIFIVSSTLYVVGSYKFFLLSALLSLVCYIAIVGIFRIKNFKGGVLSKYGRVTYTGYIIHFAILELILILLKFFGLLPYMRFEMVFPVAAVLTYLVSRSIVNVTELYWQNIADRICAKMDYTEEYTSTHSS